MANVINPAYLSMPAQVQKNMEDIKALRNSAFVATPAGQYSAATTYGKGALVAYTDGNIYYHFSDTETQGVPPTDTANWVIYQEGIPGPQGEQGIQGAPGNDGKDGVTPNITATATVSNTTGTPSVNVSKGGTAENPSFAFAFQNIKGEPGAQGTPGTPGADGQGYNDMGEWVSGNEYHSYDVVTYRGTSYNCTAAIASSVMPPNQDTAHFEVFASGGLSALTYNGTIAANSVPVVSMPLANFIKTSFNRVPEVGDQFLAIVTYAGQSYLCGMTVTSVESTNVSATVGTVTALQGGGAGATLYRHNLLITTSQITAAATVYSYSSEQINRTTFSQMVPSSENGYFSITGYAKISDTVAHPLYGVYYNDSLQEFYFAYSQSENPTNDALIIALNSLVVSDYVQN